MLGVYTDDVYAVTHISELDFGAREVNGTTVYSYADDASYSTGTPSNTMTESIFVANFDGGFSMLGSNDYLFSISIDEVLEKVTSNDNNSVSRRYYIVYNGTKFYANDNIIQFIVRGAYISVFSLYVEFTSTAYSKISYSDKSYRFISSYVTPKLTINHIYCNLYELAGSDYTGNVDYVVNGSIQQGNQLQQEQNNLQQQGNQLQQEQNQTTSNIFSSITDFFGSFFDNLVHIVVPEEGYFEDFFSRLNDFFSEKLGMLYAPIDMLVELLETIKNSSGSSGIVFPELEFNGYVIIEEQTVDLQAVADNFEGLQDALYFGTDVLMVGGVLVLLQNKLKEVLKT